MRITNIASIALAVIISGGFAVAKDDSTAAIKAAFSKTPAMEVPAKAAELVSQAKATERDVVAADVVKVALQKSPAIAPAIVGAVVKKSPDTAPVVATTAATLQPKQLKLIAQAAAAAAPAKAREIVKALCSAFPKETRTVALAVADVAPKSAAEILAGVSDAIPALKPLIDQATAAHNGSFTVVAVLNRVAADNATAPTTVATGLRAPAVSARGPSVQPPYNPLLVTPTDVPPTSGEVPPGGRDYAAP